jgi:CRISP-associated protein Cas1
LKEGVERLHDLLAWFDLPALPPWLGSIIGIRTFEGQAAGLYFAAWKGYPLSWRKSARRYVPPHWQTVRERGSPLSDSARHAVDPANAILNYAYGVLEAQCRQALAAEGFDLGCGFLHADKQYRDSLVYDLMELFRPGVDALVLALLGRTTFAYGDLVMTHEGRCRLHPQLARAVAASCRVEQERVREGAQQLREMLVEGVVSTRPIL